MRVVLRMSLVLLVFVAELSAQQPDLWGGLPRGPHPVGYRAVHQLDAARVFPAPDSWFGKSKARDRRRPVWLQLWYPTSKAPPRRSGAYAMYLSPRLRVTPVADSLSLGLQRRTLGVHYYVLGKYFGPESAGLHARLRGVSSVAIPNAPPDGGRHPVILYAAGASHSTDENVVLWEFLASHGYIVIAVPSVGHDQVDAATDATGLATQVRDLEEAIRYLAGFAGADLTRMGVMGFSFGGAAALMLAMRNADIDAVAALDAAFMAPEFPQLMRDFPYYSPDHVSVPLLELHRRDAEAVTYGVLDSLRYADRTSVELAGLDPIDFNNYVLLYHQVAPSRDEQVLVRVRAYTTMARQLLAFWNTTLGAARARSFDGQVAWRDFPSQAVTVRTREAMPRPLSGSELITLIRQVAADSVAGTLSRIKLEDPRARVLAEGDIDRLGDALLRGGDAVRAAAVYEWNASAHAGSAHAWDSLAEVYRALNLPACAAGAYRKVVSLTNGSARRVSAELQTLRHNAQEQLNTLSATEGTCSRLPNT